MVKAYLKFESSQSVGVVTSRECNVTFDKTGRFALTGCLEAVGVWHLRQGVQERALTTSRSTEKVTRLCVKQNSDKPICAAGYADGAVRLWNFQDGSVQQTFQGHRSAVSCLAFDAGGHMLASGSNDTDIVVWDLVAESGVARLRGHVDQVTEVLFWEASDAQARLISSSKDRLIRIWSIEMQLCLQAIADHQAEVWSLSINRTQTRLVAGSTDKFLRVWSLRDPARADDAKQLKSPEDPDEKTYATFMGAVPRAEGQGNALGLAFGCPKGLGFEVLLCQGSGRTLEIFRCFDESDVRKRLRRRKRRLNVKLQKKSGKQVEDDEPQEVDDSIHAADELTALQTHRCSTKLVSMAWCAASNTVLVGLSNNMLESVTLAPGEASEETPLSISPSTSLELAGHRTGVRALAVSHDDSLLMSTSAEALKIWSTSTGRCIRTLSSGYGLCGLFVAGNEHVLLGTKEGHLELHDIQLGELTQSLEAHSGSVYGLAERPDRQGFVTCSADRTLRFYDFTFKKGAQKSVSFKEIADKATELPDEALAVAYSPNEKWIAVALLNHTVQVLFADTLKFYLSLYGHRLPVMSIDFSSDSQILASGSADKNVRLWSTHFGNTLRSLRAHDESVMQVKFLPGTHYLATASRDRELKLWDCDSYELITVLKGHHSEILALALSQDAAFIVTAGSDRQIRFWKRTQEQMFLIEEREKELEERFEQEVEREDVQGPAGGEVVILRPSRRTIESVRTTERLMEVLDEATTQVEQLNEAESASPVEIPFGEGSRHPVARVIGYINTLNSSNIYEVLLALPFSHAIKLLRFILQFFEAVVRLPDAEQSSSAAQTKVLSAAIALETPCQAALITSYVHHSELSVTASARPLLLKLRCHMRDLLQAEKDRVGLTIAGFSHMQRLIKRSSSTIGTKPITSNNTSKPSASSRPQKKRKQR